MLGTCAREKLGRALGTMSFSTAPPAERAADAYLYHLIHVETTPDRDHLHPQLHEDWTAMIAHGRDTGLFGRREGQRAPTDADYDRFMQSVISLYGRVCELQGRDMQKLDTAEE